MAMTDVFNPIGNGLLTMFVGTLTMIGIVVVVIVLAGLVFVSVRFMLAATRAAHVYVALHGTDAPARTVTDGAPAATAPPAAKPAAEAAAKSTAKPASKPASKPAPAKSTSQPKG